MADKDKILEGSILPASSETRASPPKLVREDPKKGVRNINVTRICAEMDFNPVETLVHIARFDKDALGTNEEIRVFEARAAASELLSYQAPKLKAKEYVDTEEEFKPVLEYAPKRGEQKRLETLGEIDNDDD